MAKIVTITNPLTGQPAQVDQLDHTAQQIDDGLNIARGVSNPNLSDNWYFCNPINQRGQTSYTGTNIPVMDRWVLQERGVSSGTPAITLNENGLVLANDNTICVQRCEKSLLQALLGKKATISFLFADKTLEYMTFQLPETMPVGNSANGSTESVTIYSIAAFGSEYQLFKFYMRNTSKTIEAVKFELGTQQTLAHQENGVWVLNEIPDYGEQLARCQRSSCLLFDISNYGRVGLVVAEGSDIAHLYIPTPVTMRAIPSIQFLHGSISDLYLARSGSYTPISGVSCINKCAGYLDILLNTSGLTEGNVYTVRAKKNRVCILAIS